MSKAEWRWISQIRCPGLVSSLRGTIMAAAIVNLCSACTLLAQRNTQWSYTNPPTPGVVAVLPDDGVWCPSPEKAFVMATTGFFIDGCSTSALQKNEFKVIGIEHIAANDVLSWVVKVSDSRDNTRWIPLPDHNWA